MASREPITIFDLPIRPLTMIQVERLEGLMLEQPEKQMSSVKLAREVVKVALDRDHGEVIVDDIECTMLSLSDAMQDVLCLGGFMPPGEARAAALNASTGDGSEAG